MLRSARDTTSHTSAFSRHVSPELSQIRCPSSKEEGAGNAGCALHPRSRVPKLCIWAHTSIQGSGNTPTSPAQWLYGLLRALPGERACCHRRRRDTSRQLSASIAAPGPHDFAVRFGVFVRRDHSRLTPKRPSHPVPYVCDDRETPLLWARDRRSYN